MVLMGNKTASGSEPLDILGDPIVDDADARARFGLRSELYAMYRQVTAVPQDGTIYAIAATPSAGVASACVFTIAVASDASSSYEFTCHGEVFTVSVENGTNQSDTADLIAAAFTAHDEGRLQVTAVAAIDGAGPGYTVTVTYSQTGDRGDDVIGQAATRGIRVKKIGTNTQTVVKTVGSFVPGGAADDHSAAIAELSNFEFFYHVTAKTDTVTLTATDNGVGEYMTMLKTQALPLNGRDQQLHVGLVGTQAEATAVAKPRLPLWQSAHRQTVLSAGSITRRTPTGHPRCWQLTIWPSVDSRSLRTLAPTSMVGLRPMVRFTTSQFRF
jgi:phage tail sheath gpL-like